MGLAIAFVFLERNCVVWSLRYYSVCLHRHSFLFFPLHSIQNIQCSLCSSFCVSHCGIEASCIFSAMAVLLAL